MPRRKKPKVGPPFKFKKEYVEQARVACEEMGATDSRLAKLFGVEIRTIYRWKRDYPKFKKAVVEGKDTFDTEKIK